MQARKKQKLHNSTYSYQEYRSISLYLFLKQVNSENNKHTNKSTTNTKSEQKHSVVVVSDENMANVRWGLGTGMKDYVVTLVGTGDNSQWFLAQL